MAMINCPECGSEISNQAKSCPNCGYSFRKNSSGLSIAAFVLSFITCLNIIAIVLAVTDIAIGDKKTKHVLSGWAIAISIISNIILFFFYFVLAIFA